MVIKEERPLSMAEVMELVGDSEKGEQIKKFIKSFGKMKGDVKKMEKELMALELIKLKAEHIVKIVDFKPSNASELNKIIPDVSFDSDEVGKITDVVSRY